MYPTLKPGDLIIVSKQSSYKDGDIVAYFANEKVVIHRIINAESISITTKGDNNNTEDKEKISKNKIIGKTLFKVPLLGFIPIVAKATIDSI